MKEAQDNQRVAYMETLPKGGGTILPSTGEFIPRHLLDKQLNIYREQIESMENTFSQSKRSPGRSSQKKKK
ncbi:MAG: hypothetical protein AAGH40_00485 [Verrucomicrobiota bacterium]